MPPRRPSAFILGGLQESCCQVIGDAVDLVFELTEECEVAARKLWHVVRDRLTRLQRCRFPARSLKSRYSVRGLRPTIAVTAVVICPLSLSVSSRAEPKLTSFFLNSSIWRDCLVNFFSSVSTAILPSPSNMRKCSTLSTAATMIRSLPAVGISLTSFTVGSNRRSYWIRAIQIRAETGAGFAWIVRVDSPPAPRARSHVSFGMGRSVMTWRKNAPSPPRAQSRLASRPWPALGISTRYFGPLSSLQ